MVKRCYFKVNDHKCSILKSKACMRCHFFKTEEEVKAGRKKAKERIKTLSPQKQREIRDKYEGEII